MAKGLHFWAMVGLASLACFRAGAMTEDECDAFYRLDEAEKARRFAVMGEADKWSYIASAVRRLNDLSLEPPKLILNTLPRYGYDKNDYAMNNGVAVTAKGRIWVSWIGGEDGPKAHMLGAWSDDGGQTFSPPKFVIDPHFAKNRLYNLKVDRTALIGNVWAAPDGSLRIYVNSVVQGWDGRGSTWEIICRNPDAAVPVWEAPRYLWHGDQHNKPTVMRDGTWLLPINLNGSSFAFKEYEKYMGCGFLASTDQGRTWTPRAMVRPADHRIGHICENAAVELSDGRLWMLMRTNRCFFGGEGFKKDFNGLMETWSEDGGRSWRVPTPAKTLHHIMSRFALIRLSSGSLLFIKHGASPLAHPPLTAQERKEENPWVVHYTLRRELTAFVSRDDGKTWEGGLRLEQDPGMVSYPDAQQTADGSVWCTYDYERHHDGQIRLARFTEADVRAKRLVTPSSFLGRIAIRPRVSRNERELEKKKAKIETTY